jgi:hypothetical protein
MKETGKATVFYKVLKFIKVKEDGSYVRVAIFTDKNSNVSIVRVSDDKLTEGLRYNCKLEAKPTRYVQRIQV